MYDVIVLQQLMDHVSRRQLDQDQQWSMLLFSSLIQNTIHAIFLWLY